MQLTLWIHQLLKVRLISINSHFKQRWRWRMGTFKEELCLLLFDEGNREEEWRASESNEELSHSLSNSSSDGRKRRSRVVGTTQVSRWGTREVMRTKMQRCSNLPLFTQRRVMRHIPIHTTPPFLGVRDWPLGVGWGVAYMTHPCTGQPALYLTRHWPLPCSKHLQTSPHQEAKHRRETSQVGRITSRWCQNPAPIDGWKAGPITVHGNPEKRLWIPHTREKMWYSHAQHQDTHTRLKESPSAVTQAWTE